MAKRPLIIQNFSGGKSVDPKIAPANSFANSMAVDFRKFPSQLTLLPAPYREDGGVVTDLIQNEVIVQDGTIYALGDTGKFYRRTTAGEWSLIGTVSDAAYGLLYRKDQDTIYISGLTTVSIFSPVSNNPTLKNNFYNISQSTYNNTTQTGFNVNTNQSNGTETTSIATSISESDSAKRFFQMDMEPLNKIALRIADKGTGDWTVTVHDGLNNDLGSATVANADLTSSQFNDFVFSAPIRLSVAPAAQTYHIHVTSTVADGTVFSTIANDLRTADLQMWADRLVNPTNGMHPMDQIQQFIIIGNERYLAAYEPLGTPDPGKAEFNSQKLQFPPQYEVCGIATTSEYAAIACEQTSSDVNADPQEGVIFFWDGLSSTYNFFIRIPEGSPYGIHAHKNVLYYEAGGTWYALQPFSDSQPQKLTQLPYGENGYGNNNNETKVYPYASTVRNGVQLMAWPSITTNENIPYGIYSFGRVDDSFPNSFGYSYTISTGATTWSSSNNLTIGMIKNFGSTLHISWRDDSNDTGSYGVDVVDENSAVPRFATWESLIFDNGYVGKQKQAEYMDAAWLPLPDGVEIRLKYSIERGDWIYSDLFSNSNTYEDLPNYARWYIGEQGQQARFNEIQFGVDFIVAEGVLETPIFLQIGTIIDNLADEALE